MRHKLRTPTDRVWQLLILCLSGSFVYKSTDLWNQCINKLIIFSSFLKKPSYFEQSIDLQGNISFWKPNKHLTHWEQFFNGLKQRLPSLGHTSFKRHKGITFYRAFALFCRNCCRTSIAQKSPFKWFHRSMFRLCRVTSVNTNNTCSGNSQGAFSNFPKGGTITVEISSKPADL